ncbi:hypothetical protein WDU94_011459, partial [Cyamophila willieti]
MDTLKQALMEEQGFGPYGVYRKDSFELPSLNITSVNTGTNEKPSFDLPSLNTTSVNSETNEKSSFELPSLNTTSVNAGTNEKSPFELPSLNNTLVNAGTNEKSSVELPSLNNPLENAGTKEKSSFELPSLNYNTVSTGTKGKPSGEEIGQENLKHSLQEIISEIEQVASHDEQLLEDESQSANQPETRSDHEDSMPGELKYDFLRRESGGKLNEGTKKGFSEQLSDYWKTSEQQESKPLVSDYMPTPDLLNFYKKKPVPTQTYVPQPKANVTIQDSKENVMPVELQDTDDKDPVIKGEEVLGEINSLIVHLEQITKRPRSLPPDINIFHLWKSLQ